VASKRRRFAAKPLGPNDIPIYQTNQFININTINNISGEEAVALSKSVTWDWQTQD
jgi:hypothetical protein